MSFCEWIICDKKKEKFNLLYSGSYFVTSGIAEV